MKATVIKGSIERVARQRNLFLALTLMLASSLVLMSLRLSLADQKIVLVPGISAEMSVSNKGVSGSYLEQMAMVFLSELLDISPADIKHKRDLVLKYTSRSDVKYSEKINEYFAKAEEDYTRFDLATHFTVKNLQVSQEELEVIANGVLTSWYGKKGHESKEVSYKIGFDYSGGQLRLKEFGRIKDENDGKN
jgi:type IV conjugative transfer system protein TraE